MLLTIKHPLNTLPQIYDKANPLRHNLLLDNVTQTVFIQILSLKMIII